MDCSKPGFLSFTMSQSLLKLMSIESGMPSNHFTFCRPLLLLPSISPSLRVFFSESALSIRWPKYWSFRGSISPSNEYSWLISSRIDWFDLLAVQGTLKSLLKHHSSKALILQCSAFFMVQLSHPNMTTGKTLALTIWTFVSKWCLCFLICCLRLSSHGLQETWQKCTFSGSTESLCRWGPVICVFTGSLGHSDALESLRTAALDS